MKTLLLSLLLLTPCAALSAWAGWTFSLTTQAHGRISVWQDGNSIELSDGITVCDLTQSEAALLAEALKAAADGKLKPEEK